ncbi:MAG: hypothetical protein MUD02_07880, partial [Bacteroidales bacterium]|nr:hypothetical protein [Bacteroidales bacterium]
ADMKERFGFEFYPYLNDWFNTKEQPGFLISDLQVKEIVVSDRTRYQVTFVASNPEPVPGIFNVAFRTPGSGGGGRGGGMMTSTFQGGGPGGGYTVVMQGRGMDVSDISKIVLLGPLETKRVGIVLDGQPRAMILNTLFTRNIPGEITLPVNDIAKTRGLQKEFTGEETLATAPLLADPSEIIVDNEDPGFINGQQVMLSPLKKFFGISRRSGLTYETIRMWNIPEYWQPVVQNYYYGKYVRSSVYTRGGTGDRSVIWKTAISDPGYYDIYCYVGKAVNRMAVRAGAGGRAGGQGGQGGPGGPGSGDFMGPPQQEDQFKDMHYKIYHDEGVEEITLDYENAEGGWNMLGRYYLSPDSAKVELTNQTTGRLVIGDAVRWVRQR